MSRIIRYKHPKAVAFILSFPELFWRAWFFMLVAGGLHSAYHAIPAFGYWWSVAISWIVGGIIGSKISLRDIKHNKIP